MNLIYIVKITADVNLVNNKISLQKSLQMSKKKLLQYL